MMAKYVDLYDDRNYYIGEDGEYQKWNIDPKVIEEAADVVEIVRCGNCKNWERDWESANYKNKRYCVMLNLFTTGEWFCPWGERRTYNA